MKLTYIFHSGFVLETEASILVFDYWQDPSRVLPPILGNTAGKHVYIFVSHFHEDHFNNAIFTWREKHSATGCATSQYTYIMSKDILRHRRAKREDGDVWLAKGGCWKDENIRIFATGSNDSGVSWIVETEERRIFHAGDLCNWYARFLSDDALDTLVYSKEFRDYINPVLEEKRFLGELKDIRKITDSFDIVMFPVDGRIGNGYTRGGRQFIERFNVRTFIPMHFVACGFESAWRMEEFCRERNIEFWRISKEGDSISINDISIRHAHTDDLPQLMDIFAHARDFMTNTGNPGQWTNGYPDRELLMEDIDNNDSFVCIDKGEIVATFVLRGGNDPTYGTIYNGAWPNDRPYATIHRIASNGKVNGIFRTVVKHALQKYNSIRLDTHPDNKPMRNAVRKAGFKYCGIIHCWNGDERLAYQLDK